MSANSRHSSRTPTIATWRMYVLRAAMSTASPSSRLLRTGDGARNVVDARVNVEAHAGVAEVVETAESASIQITTHLWQSWVSIAIDRAHAARRARTEAQ